MRQNTESDRRRFRADLYEVGGRDSPDQLPAFTNTGLSPSPLMPSEGGGQLGRNIILASQRLYLGNAPIRNFPLATRQTFRDFAMSPGFVDSPRSATIAPGIRAKVITGQPTRRSLFDVAGRLHDFQSAPKIARPNLAEEMIPVVGPAWDAAADLQDGHYGSAAFNVAMALGDISPVGYGLKAGRGAMKLIREMKTLTPKAAAIQRKMHKIGLALPSDDVHHIFELNGLGRYVPNWKNNPLFLKVLPREVHQRLHRRWGGKPKFGLLPRLWHGTTDWMKAAAAGTGTYAMDGIENAER